MKKRHILETTSAYPPISIIVVQSLSIMPLAGDGAQSCWNVKSIWICQKYFLNHGVVTIFKYSYRGPFKCFSKNIDPMMWLPKTSQCDIFFEFHPLKTYGDFRQSNNVHFADSLIVWKNIHSSQTILKHVTWILDYAVRQPHKIASSLLSGSSSVG